MHNSTLVQNQVDVIVKECIDSDYNYEPLNATTAVQDDFELFADGELNDMVPKPVIQQTATVIVPDDEPGTKQQSTFGHTTMTDNQLPNPTMTADNTNKMTITDATKLPDSNQQPQSTAQPKASSPTTQDKKIQKTLQQMQQLSTLKQNAIQKQTDEHMKKMTFQQRQQVKRKRQEEAIKLVNVKKPNPVKQSTSTSPKQHTIKNNQQHNLQEQEPTNENRACIHGTHYIDLLLMGKQYHKTLLKPNDYFDQKMQSILAFKTQFFDPNSSEPETPISGKDFLEFIESRMRQFGRPIGAKYGEGFTVERYPGVDLLTDLI